MRCDRSALDLDGWDDTSVWGWDDQTSSYFALLWPNVADDEMDAPPTHCLGAGCRSRGELAAAIATATGFSLEDCLASLE